MIAGVNYYQNSGLVPAHEPDLARTVTVSIAPGAVILKGTVLGQVNGSGTAVNEVQTLTPGGTISGGTFTITFADGQITAPIPFNATAAQVKDAIDLVLGFGNVTVTGGPLTSGAFTVTFTGLCGGMDQPLLIVGNSLTGTSPTVTVAQTTAGAPAFGYFRPYASGNSDGSQVAKGVAQFDMVADVYGKITFGTQQGGGDFRVKDYGGSIFVSGYFFTSQLVGLDATAVSALGRLVSGNTTTLTQATTIIRIN